MKKLMLVPAVLLAAVSTLPSAAFADVFVRGGSGWGSFLDFLSAAWYYGWTIFN